MALSCKSATKPQVGRKAPEVKPISSSYVNISVVRQAAAAAAAATLASLAVCTSSAMAADAAVEANFANKCAGCHLQGGNVVAAGATLFTADLQRNGVADPDSLYQLIYAGKNKMPGFGKDCAPKGKCTFGPRLQDEEVSALAQYVLERAAADWK